MPLELSLVGLQAISETSLKSMPDCIAASFGLPHGFHVADLWLALPALLLAFGLLGFCWYFFG
jgi:hypothetical protein